MSNIGSVDQILDFAISEEVKAAEFYTGFAQCAKNPAMREAFEEFAKEEQGHKEKLLIVKEGKSLAISEKETVDLKISDYVVDVVPNQDMDYMDALALAAKKEEVAFKLYTKLAAVAEDAKVKTLFQELAQEEKKHKLRFETEYDDALKDN